MPETPAADPGNANPDAWSEPFSDADLAELCDLVDNPDNLVTASLAGTLYDPEHGTDEGAL
jgi:hypothetical protein